jgi:hypothetical protein
LQASSSASAGVEEGTKVIEKEVIDEDEDDENEEEGIFHIVCVYLFKYVIYLF